MGSESNTQPVKRQKPRLLLIVLCVAAVLAALVYLAAFRLNADDQRALDLMIANRFAFNNPKSLKVISGLSGVSEADGRQYAYLCVTAENKVGGNVRDYLHFDKEGISDVSDTELYVRYCKSDSLHASKINLRYALYWIFK